MNFLFFFKFLKYNFCDNDDNYSKWAIALIQKCHYKWQPRKCTNLNGANLIIFIFENDKIP